MSVVPGVCGAQPATLAQPPRPPDGTRPSRGPALAPRQVEGGTTGRVMGDLPALSTHEAHLWLRHRSLSSCLRRIVDRLRTIPPCEKHPNVLQGILHPLFCKALLPRSTVCCIGCN